MDLRLVSEPLPLERKLDVVSVEEVKAQARVKANDQDELIAFEIEAAYDYLSGPNGWLGRCCLLNEDWELYADSNSRFVEIPLRPFVWNTVVFGWLQDDETYLDVDVAAYALSSFPHGFSQLQQTRGVQWPYPRHTYHPRAYRMQFTAGFGDSADDVPAGIRKAIRLLAAEGFRNREASSEKAEVRIPYGVQSYAGRYRFANDHA